MKHATIRPDDFARIRAALIQQVEQGKRTVPIEVAELLLEAAHNLHHALHSESGSYGPAKTQLKRAREQLGVVFDTLTDDDDGDEATGTHRSRR